MFKRNKLSLTDGTCELLENMRLAIEILTGERVRIKRMELDLKDRSGHGQFHIGLTAEGDVLFAPYWKNRISFRLKLNGGEPVWYEAQMDDLVDEPGVLRVITAAGEDTKWIVGRSATDRWEVPLFKK